VIIWSSHDGQILKQLRGHSRGILGLATWPSYFASADADGEIQIWNHEVRTCVIELSDHIDSYRIQNLLSLTVHMIT
jgi:WD40 repeat protein